MNFSQRKLVIRSTVPPGDSLVGVRPHTLFRLERVRLGVHPGIHLAHPLGHFVPFDGGLRQFRGFDGTTLCVGSLFAFQVKNDTPRPEAIELEVYGTAVDWDAPEVSHQLVLGLFAQEAVEAA